MIYGSYCCKCVLFIVAIYVFTIKGETIFLYIFFHGISLTIKNTNGCRFLFFFLRRFSPIATMIHMVTIKLPSTNFLQRKRQAIPVLTSYELLGFVNGKELVPPPTVLTESGEYVPNPDYIKWLSTDQCLLVVLFSTLSKEAIVEAIEYITSQEAWMAWEAAFSHSYASCVHQLSEELLSLRRGSLSVKDYSARFKGLCDQLSAVDKPVETNNSLNHKGLWITHHSLWRRERVVSKRKNHTSDEHETQKSGRKQLLTPSNLLANHFSHCFFRECREENT